MKNKLGIEEGQWVVADAIVKLGGEKQLAVRLERKRIICLLSEKEKQTEEDVAIGALIADAGNTFQVCELLPSELLAQRNELLEALIDVVTISDRNHIAWDKAKQAIKNATE